MGAVVEEKQEFIFGKTMILLRRVIALAVLAVLAAGLCSPLSAVPPESFYADVRDYLPEGYVTDGSVDYKTYIQKCFDENAQVYFPGSNDPERPFVYGTTPGLKTKPFSVISFGPNTVLRRRPSLGEDSMLTLGRGSRLTGAVIDGNKYAHWPLVKDRPKEPYAFVIGHAVVMLGENVLTDCFVYNNAGIAFGAWGSSNNKIYRSRAENCGFLEAIGTGDYWGGEIASGDGFFFGIGSHNNIVKDCEAYDCSRWGFVIGTRSSHNTLVDCRGGNLHFSCYGFLDVESSGPLNSLIRCRSPNSQLCVNFDQQDTFSCTATTIVAEAASYSRLLFCTTIGGPLRFCTIRDDKIVVSGRKSPMLSLNRIFLDGPSSDHSLSVICEDGGGLVTDNVLYGFGEAEKRSTNMLLYGVAVRTGNLQLMGNWQPQIRQFPKPYYLRGHVDWDFRKQHE